MVPGLAQEGRQTPADVASPLLHDVGIAGKNVDVELAEGDAILTKRPG